MTVAAQAMAPSLRRPMHFIVPLQCVWPEFRDQPFHRLSEEALARNCRESIDCWVVRTWYELKLAGYDVTTGPQAAAGRVNVANARDFGIRNRGARPFLLITRADCHQPALANYVVCQNRHGATDLGVTFIPHWSQPAIVPRDAKRSPRVRELGYKGHPRNLDESFRDASFVDALAERGVGFGPFKDDPDGWRDYSACDAVLAVRNLTIVDAQSKPASKLMNAWRGETPALLGPEPAYRELRRGPLDYLEVRTPADALAAIDRLNAEPELFRAMVSNGVARRDDYSDARILAMWVEMLNGPVADAFDAWERRSLPARTVFYVSAALRERRRRNAFYDACRQGPRILQAACEEPAFESHG